MTGIRDAIFLAGFGSLLYGLHSWWPPGAYIIGGLSVMGIAYLWEVLMNDPKHPGPSG